MYGWETREVPKSTKKIKKEKESALHCNLHSQQQLRGPEIIILKGRILCILQQLKTQGPVEEVVTTLYRFEDSGPDNQGQLGKTDASGDVLS
jgi:hypothetical protein